MGIRDLFEEIWPTCPKEHEINPEKVFKPYYDGSRELRSLDTTSLNLRLYETSKYLFDEERERHIGIEKKAANFLVAIVIFSALTIGLVPLALEGKVETKDVLIYVALGFYIMSFAYLVRASILSLKVFGKIDRQYLGPPDLVPTGAEKEDSYLKRLILKFVEYTIENYKIDNKLESYVHTAQKFIRNAVISLAILCLLLILYALTSTADHTTLQIAGRVGC